MPLYVDDGEEGGNRQQQILLTKVVDACPSIAARSLWSAANEAH